MSKNNVQYEADEEFLSIIPKWFDKSFIEQSLSNYLKDTRAINVHSYDILPVTAKGECFASILFRVKVNYSGENLATKTDSFIIKTEIDNPYSLKLLTELDIYNKELEMYGTILPKISAILKKGNVIDDLFAKTVGVNYDNRSIVFEDLSLRGFVMPPRSNGLDMAHLKILLNGLAEFHAAAAVLQEQQTDVYKNFKHGMLNRNKPTFSTFYITSLEVLTEMLAEWENYEIYVEKLKKLKSSLIEKGTRSFDAKPNQFNTLIHGDIWINNSMFTYNRAGQPEKIMLVDFQFSCWSSPAVDLHYLFNTSIQEDLRLHHQDELIQFYHSALKNSLEKFHYLGHIPTLHEFHVQMVDNMFYGFMTALLVQPIHLNEINDDADIEAIHSNNARALRYRKTIYSNEKVRKILRTVIPIFDRKGMLD